MFRQASYVLVSALCVTACGPTKLQPSAASGTAGAPLGLGDTTVGTAGAAAPSVSAPTQIAATAQSAGAGSFVVPMSQVIPKGGPSTSANGAPPGAAPGTSGAAPAAAGCRTDGPCSHGTEPVIPQPVGECPPMVTGPFALMGVISQIWVGNKSESQKGPIMLYWHGTGGTALTATAELDPTLVAEIMGAGGMIGSIEGGLEGDTLDWGVFTTGDY